MKKRLLFILVFLFLIQNIFAVNNFYAIELEYNYNESRFDVEKLNFQKYEIILSNENLLDKNLVGGYVAEILDNNEEILTEVYFGINNEIIYDEFDEEGYSIGGGIKRLKNVNFILYLPYYKNTNLINIYGMDLDKEISIDVSDFSKDLTFDQDEIKENNNNFPVEDNQNIGDVIAEDSLGLSFFIWLIILIGILVIGFVFYKKFKRNN